MLDVPPPRCYGFGHMSASSTDEFPTANDLLTMLRANYPAAAEIVERHLASLRAQVKTGGFAFKSAVLLLSLELRSEPLPESPE